MFVGACIRRDGKPAAGGCQQEANQLLWVQLQNLADAPLVCLLVRNRQLLRGTFGLLRCCQCYVADLDAQEIGSEQAQHIQNSAPLSQQQSVCVCVRARPKHHAIVAGSRFAGSAKILQVDNDVVLLRACSQCHHSFPHSATGKMSRKIGVLCWDVGAVLSLC